MQQTRHRERIDGSSAGIFARPRAQILNAEKAERSKRSRRRRREPWSTASSNATRGALAPFFFGGDLLRLKALHKNFRRFRNMHATERLRFSTVARDDSVEDRDVLLQDRLRHLDIVA